MSGDRGHMKTMRLLPFAAAAGEGSLDGPEPRSLAPDPPIGHDPCRRLLSRAQVRQYVPMVVKLSSAGLSGDPHPMAGGCP
jgi:hypothetical protein